MADMVKIDGVKELLQRFKAEARARGGRASVTVGYTQSYAVYVHENLEAKHPVGQAKFLEQPAREMAEELGDIIARAMQRGAAMLQALYMAGLRLQRESQKLVPVDTGALKGSAFTRRDTGEEASENVVGEVGFAGGPEGGEG